MCVGGRSQRTTCHFCIHEPVHLPALIHTHTPQRVDMAGPLLAGLFKGCFKRMVKDFKKTLQEAVDKVRVREKGGRYRVWVLDAAGGCR